MAYLSWGQGIESEVAPNRARYSNAGQSLPALTSRQVEAGVKHSGTTLDWRVAAFQIHRRAKIPSCSPGDSIPQTTHLDPNRFRCFHYDHFIRKIPAVQRNLKSPFNRRILFVHDKNPHNQSYQNRQ